jgi:uncharacterized protein involved in exopolysaccharide biosynthesis
MPGEVPIRGRIQQNPTMRDVAMVLFRKRRVCVCVAAVVFACAILYAITGTKYQATMKVLVRRGRADAPVSTAVNAPLDLTRTEITEAELNSEVELLRDTDVLRRVIEQTGAGGRDWFHALHWGQSTTQRKERAARRLGEKLEVQPIKKTNLIAIRYRTGAAESAARVLSSLAAAYMEKHTAVHRTPGELLFFEQQTEESRRQVEASTRRLLDFSKSHGVIAAAQQRDLALQKISELEAAERQTVIEVAETRRRASELEEQLARLSERTVTQVRTADNPELLRSLKATLLDLQLKRTQLLTKFEPTHRLVKEVNEQIAQAETAINNEKLSPVRDETSDKNANYEWAKGELLRAHVQLRSLEAREAAASGQEWAWHRVAAKLAEDAIVQDDLLSTQKTAEENYLLYVRKREEARMNDALDQRGIVNVVIAEQPIAPALPVWSPWSVLAIGFLGAGLAGVGAAFGADHLDPRFRDLDELQACLNVPVLASFPRDTRGMLRA